MCRFFPQECFLHEHFWLDMLNPKIAMKCQIYRSCHIKYQHTQREHPRLTNTRIQSRSWKLLAQSPHLTKHSLAGGVHPTQPKYRRKCTSTQISSTLPFPTSHWTYDLPTFSNTKPSKVNPSDLLTFRLFLRRRHCTIHRGDVFSGGSCCAAQCEASKGRVPTCRMSTRIPETKIRYN